MLPIALQLYSIRDSMEADFRGSLEQVKQMGYDGVEFAGLHGRTPQEIKEMLAEIGLAALSAHVPFADMMADPQKVLSDYATIGCRYVAIPYVTEEYRPGADRFAEVVEGAKKLGEIANSLGMTLLYHNHDFEFEQVDGKYGLDILYDSVPADLLQTEIDTCWVKVAGLDPAEYLKKYTGRAPVVHLKDFFQSGQNADMYELIGIEKKADGSRADSFEFRPLGSGMQDIPSILEASEAAGAQWLVVEQDRPTAGKTALECVNLSISYLRNR